jgi:hypothetical protein
VRSRQECSQCILPDVDLTSDCAVPGCIARWVDTIGCAADPGASADREPRTPRLGILGRGQRQAVGIHTSTETSGWRKTCCTSRQPSDRRSTVEGETVSLAAAQPAVSDRDKFKCRLALIDGCGRDRGRNGTGDIATGTESVKETPMDALRLVG